MDNSTVMRVLIVDDAISEWAAAIAFFRQAGVAAEVLGSTNVSDLEKLIAEEKAEKRGFDVTLVDLGLGAGRPSGLSALEVLHREQVGGRVAVQANLADDTTRLLLTYAAFQWYDETTVALIPKVDSTQGATYEKKAKSFVESVNAVREGKVLSPNMAASFRKPRVGINYFHELIKTSTDLRKFKLMRRFDSFDEAATAGGYQRSTSLSGWGKERLDLLEFFLPEASKNLAGLVVEPITVRHGKGEENPTASIISRFARDQSLFFDDPAVQRHFGA
jgi:hypothetical protein